MAAKFRMNFGLSAIIQLVLLIFCRQRFCSASGATNEDINGGGNDKSPASTCKHFECPRYTTVHVGDQFEIRRYNHAVWMSTSDIHSNSFKAATRAGFFKLLDYVKGKNQKQQQMAMTAPVLTDLVISCETNSSYVVHLHLPDNFQENPPQSAELRAERWDGRCTAVRRFGGFADDQNIAGEAQRLQATLRNTPWERSNDSTKCASQRGPSAFSVAQYNSPLENKSRVNEIWFNLGDSNRSNCASKMG